MSKNISNSYTPRDELLLYPESKRGKRPLIIHVEDWLDIIFWRKILAPYEEKVEFQFKSIHSKWNEEKQREASASGVSMIMSLIQEGKLFLSSDEIACVDADYNLLLNEKYSQLVQKNPFIFTTQWYSIENIICHPRNLKIRTINLLQGNNCGIDFQKWLEEKASYYAPLFLLHLTYRQCGQAGDYSKDKLKADIEKIENNIGSVEKTLAKHEEFVSLMSDAVEALKDDLKSKGYEPKDYYKIMQGHMLVHQIVEPFWDSLLRNEYLKRNMDLKDLDSDIKSFFKREYSVEYLDITQEIRNRIDSTLHL